MQCLTKSVISWFDRIAKLSDVVKTPRLRVVFSALFSLFRNVIQLTAVDPRGDSRVDPQTTLTML